MNIIRDLFKKRLGALGYWLSFLILGMIIAPFSKPISSLAMDIAPVRIILSLIIIIGISSIVIRRLHDLNKSAYWSFILFVPLVDLFLGIYLGFFPGIEQGNKYGKKDKLINQLFPFLD